MLFFPQIKRKKENLAQNIFSVVVDRREETEALYFFPNFKHFLGDVFALLPFPILIRYLIIFFICGIISVFVSFFVKLMC